MKKIKILFILPALIISSFLAIGCTLSDKNDLKDISVTENENDEDESSNIAATDTDNEKNSNIGKNADVEGYKRTASSESGESSVELFKNDAGKDTTHRDTSRNDDEVVEQSTTTEETESDDDNGIVLPDDEW